LLSAAGQRLPQDLAVLRLSRAAMLGGPDTQGADHIVIQVPDRERSQRALLLRMLSLHADSWGSILMQDMPDVIFAYGFR
jgi:hypothetical protein